MKRSLIACITALSVVATPALAATGATVKPTNASFKQHKKGKLASTKLAKASLRASKEKKSN